MKRVSLPKAPRDDGATGEPAWTSTPPDFTPGTVRNALSMAQLGDLHQAAEVCDAILSDGRLRGLIWTRINTLFGCPIEFEPAGDGRRSAQPIKALEDGEFWEICEEANLARLCAWGFLLNKGIGELVWEREPDGERRWLQKLVTKHPRNLHRDVTGTKWMLRTADGTDVEVTPGDGRWVLFQPFGDTTSPAVGLWYATALIWLSATFADFDWSRRNEARGRAALVGTTPKDANADEVDEDDVKEFGKMIAGLRTNPGIALPPGYDLKSVDFGASDHETFKTKGDRAYSSASILWLGQTLSTEVTGGSFAATKEHNKVRQDYLESDEAAVSTFIRPQILRPWASVRFSDPSLAPWARFDTEPEEDLAAAADTTQKASLALTNLLDRGVDVDVEAFCERFDIPIKSGVVTRPAPAAAPPAPGQPNPPPAAPPPAKPAKATAAQD